ncbi:hypothetical protein [uncultured Bartonella sp.]|uniref:hypothetical protein n=1 Tax=uncultured Bartonella sp. TaxID=104108 RepID=UPI0026137088|nr:hypothetical protein [uncultured Bartonella sp.]
MGNGIFDNVVDIRGNGGADTGTNSCFNRTINTVYPTKKGASNGVKSCTDSSTFIPNIIRLLMELVSDI